MKKYLGLLIIVLILPLLSQPATAEEFYIKDQYSALYSIDSSSLVYSQGGLMEQFAAPHITWDIASDDAGNIYYIKELGRNSSESIYRYVPGTGITGKEILIAAAPANARGLAYGDGCFYTSSGNAVTITKIDALGGVTNTSFSLSGVSDLRGLDFAREGDKSYLYAVSGAFNTNKIYKIDLSSIKSGSAAFTTIDLATSGYEVSLGDSRYGSIKLGTYNGQQAFFLTKDDRTGLGLGEYSVEPLDLIRVVSLDGSTILYEAVSFESGSVGTDGKYINWANPTGLEFVNGSLIVASSQYWNKGPITPPESVPEPSTLLLLGVGLLGIAILYAKWSSPAKAK